MKKNHKKEKGLTQKQLNKAIQTMRRYESMTNPDAAYFAYCPKHDKLHSSSTAEKGCFSQLLTLEHE